MRDIILVQGKAGGTPDDFTLRDLFAGLAASGILANPTFNAENTTPNVLAADSYLIADRLLMEREERGREG